MKVLMKRSAPYNVRPPSTSAAAIITTAAMINKPKTVDTETRG